MPRFRRFVNRLTECFTLCFGRRRRRARVGPLEFEAEVTLEKRLEFSAREPPCSSPRVDVCVSPELDEVVSFHSPQVSASLHSSPSAEEDLLPRSSSLSTVSLSSTSLLTASPDLQMVDVEDEEDMENILGKSSDLQVVSVPDLEITNTEEKDYEEELERIERNIQTLNTLLLTQSGPMEPKQVAWLEDSEEEEEEEEVSETEVMEFKAYEQEEEEFGSSQKKEKQQPQSRRKVSVTWIEERAKERVDRIMKMENEKRERLHQRYRNDPKLRHLKVNKFNPHYDQ